MAERMLNTMLLTFLNRYKLTLFTAVALTSMGLLPVADSLALAVPPTKGKVESCVTIRPGDQVIIGASRCGAYVKYIIRETTFK